MSLKLTSCPTTGGTTPLGLGLRGWSRAVTSRTALPVLAPPLMLEPRKLMLRCFAPNGEPLFLCPARGSKELGVRGDTRRPSLLDDPAPARRDP